MRAFLMAVVLGAIITGAAAVSLNFVPMSAKDVYTDKSNVRL